MSELFSFQDLNPAAGRIQYRLENHLPDSPRPRLSNFMLRMCAAAILKQL